jgi:ABC-2 type transport system ATP-binding protein
MLALELAAVTKRYGAREALRGIDLAVAPGSAVGLLGPNGAGKTTALRLLLGLTRPTRGGVRVGGLDPGDPASRVGLAYLPERLALPARATVAGLLRLHGTLAGLSGAELAREIDAALALTGLSDRADHAIGSLSKGLVQRLGFAQVFLGSPQILLLDEPTSGLDPLGVRDAREWILAARARGATLLVSSHVLSEVERTCDRAVILHEGRVAAEGPLGEIARPGETLEDAFVRVVRG